MKRETSTLIVIGNGFDLGHNMPTRFDNFVVSMPQFKEKYDVFKDKENSWNDIENKYGELLRDIIRSRSEFDITEEVDNIIQGWGFNQYGEVDYYNYDSEAFSEEYDQISSYIDLLNQFEQDFLNFLKANCNTEKLQLIIPRRKIAEIITTSTKIINFNYTNTVETVYGKKDVVHIHGDIYNNIAIGCGTLEEIKNSMVDNAYPTIDKFGQNKDGFAEMMAYYEEDMDGNRVENHFIKRFFDEVALATKEREKSVLSLVDKKCKSFLPLRKKVITALKEEHYDTVYIIGHSLGIADQEVLQKINKDAKFIYFYHGDLRDKENIGKMQTMEKLQWNYEMASDVDLFTK